MPKPSLSFYTNIPTPYQLAFFEELAVLFDLTVIYYAVSESNREWSFTPPSNYEAVVLRDNFIARLLQKRVLDFHFSWDIFSVSSRDKSQYVIIGGSYASPNATVALLIHRFKKKKVAYFSEPLFEVKSPLKYRFKWLYLRILNYCCKAIFCVGKKAAESFIAYQVNPKKFIIPYNIDERSFTALDPAVLGEYRKKYKPNNEIIILSSGALIQRKGMDILVKAMKKVDHRNLRLIILGSGEAQQRLEELRNGDERISFMGFQKPEELKYFFGLADIFAFASRYDGWAVVINEAIAANVPIVSSNTVGASVELISSPDYGILCETEDVDAFSRAFNHLIENPGERKRIQQSSKELIPLISSRYNAKKVLDIFRTQLN
ncbi:glycosyltransferase [Segetibacter sp. 3557_3]|uniref:glycosyltransferase family 4 protein n=1 Tax=Segetibacter sp. 3557_3 TaxID=2547429 RepID=UPI00105881EF|nr:glycosyltransferase family 4 protein [Segetibacter sp. 3557_3]TDH20827.1 glycosyltransferase [Segetibacter sp. 3557_3]